MEMNTISAWQTIVGFSVPKNKIPLTDKAGFEKNATSISGRL
jgi:hypothetical protein